METAENQAQCRLRSCRALARVENRSFSIPLVVVCSGKVYNEKAFVQPLTYMNRSGLAVVELSRRYLLPSHFLIIHDELDLPLGTIRFKRGGGTAGHHGLESIKEALNSPEFNRLRIGIGRPPADKPGAEYVLERFNEQEIPLLEETVGRAVQATMTFLSKGLDEAMNRFN